MRSLTKDASSDDAERGKQRGRSSRRNYNFLLRRASSLCQRGGEGGQVSISALPYCKKLPEWEARIASYLAPGANVS